MTPTFHIIAFSAISFAVSKPAAISAHRPKRMVDDVQNLTFSFDCRNRAVGFYADMEYDCQIFHMCDEKGTRIPHVCANDTSFNQEYRICDWEYNFDCSQSPKWFYLNELTYATDPPREEEEENHR